MTFSKQVQQMAQSIITIQSQSNTWCVNTFFRHMLCNLSPVSDKAINDVSGMNINDENWVVLGPVIFGQGGAHLYTNWHREQKSLFG